VFKQREILHILDIGRFVFLGIAYLLAIFLVVYILALVPSNFSRILDTGFAGSTFLAVLCVITVTLFFLMRPLEWARKNKWFDVSLRTVITTLLAEGLVLDYVMGRAIFMRISQYGYTLDRYIVIIGMVFFAALFLAYSVIAVWRLWAKYDLDVFQRHYAWINTIGVLVLFTVSLVVYGIDLGSISAKQHYFFSQEHGQDLDRRYVMQTGLDTYIFLTEQYPSADARRKLDIILTFKEALYRDPMWVEQPDTLRTTYQLSQFNLERDMLLSLQGAEPDPEIKEFIGFILKETEYVFIPDNFDVACGIYVEDIIGEKEEFCYTVYTSGFMD
jgi:hypothetical protein